MTPADVASFEALLPRLFGIAYRTLESPADADDVLQDTWSRWHATDRNQVRDAAAFLATTTKRLALNVAQSARARRETSLDPWPPEPADVHRHIVYRLCREDRAIPSATQRFMAKGRRREDHERALLACFAGLPPPELRPGSSCKAQPKLANNPDTGPPPRRVPAVHA
jgi:DNA-directed RNA polymerase specialized sigma24 family protein